MEAPKKLEQEDVKKFDFVKSELDYILENARFNEIQRKVFNRLTDIDGRQSIVKIIKKKILRLI